MVRLLRFGRFNSSIVLIVILIITRRSKKNYIQIPSVNKSVNLGVQGEVIRELFLIIYDCRNPFLIKL